MIDHKTPIKIALHGMDSRATKTIMMYLKGPCNGVAFLVDNPEEADADMFDNDVPSSRQLLESHLKGNLQKPVIVLSLLDFNNERTLQVRKPVITDELLSAINTAKKQLIKSVKKQAHSRHLPVSQISSPSASGIFDLGAEEDKVIDKAEVIVESESKQDKPKPKKHVAKKKSNDTVPTPAEGLLQDNAQQITELPVIEPETTEQAMRTVAIQDDPLEDLEKDWFDEWFESKKDESNDF